MTLDDIRHRLLGMPDPQVTHRPEAEAEAEAEAAVEAAIAGSVRYLASDAALRSLEADVYWPKWDAPWWHMLLLHEMGEARRIPERAVTGMIERLDAFPLKIFPVWPGELPSGADPHRDVLCHCALASVYQVLAAAGRDVDRALPWIAPWFARYQMADGGLSCDDSAYRVTGECPSSMVGTVAPLEAMLLGRPAAWTAERAAFVERAAGFLIERRLMFGSQTVHNAEERTRDITWLAPCFPRFYFYDVLRGLHALTRWAELTGRAVPLRAIEGVLEHLIATCADGVVWRKRVAYAGVGTWAPSPAGGWARRDIASRFPLLEATSGAGWPCPYLTRQWTVTRFAVLRLLDQGRVELDA